MYTLHQLHLRWDIFVTDHRSGMTLIYSITLQLSCLCVLERQVAKIRAVLRWKPISREFDGICCTKKLTNICVLWNWSGHWMAKHSVGVAVCPCEVTVSTARSWLTCALHGTSFNRCTIGLFWEVQPNRNVDMEKQPFMKLHNLIWLHVMFIQDLYMG